MATVEDLRLRLHDLHQRVAERLLVEQAHLAQDAIERRDHAPCLALRGDALVEVDAVQHPVGRLERRGARQPLIEHVDEQVDQRSLVERALRRRRRERLLGRRRRRRRRGGGLTRRAQLARRRGRDAPRRRRPRFAGRRRPRSSGWRGEPARRWGRRLRGRRHRARRGCTKTLPALARRLGLRARLKRGCHDGSVANLRGLPPLSLFPGDRARRTSVVAVIGRGVVMRRRSVGLCRGRLRPGGLGGHVRLVRGLLSLVRGLLRLVLRQLLLIEALLLGVRVVHRGRRVVLCGGDGVGLSLRRLVRPRLPHEVAGRRRRPPLRLRSGADTRRREARGVALAARPGLAGVARLAGIAGLARVARLTRVARLARVGEARAADVARLAAVARVALRALLLQRRAALGPRGGSGLGARGVVGGRDDPRDLLAWLLRGQGGEVDVGGLRQLPAGGVEHDAHPRLRVHRRMGRRRDHEGHLARAELDDGAEREDPERGDEQPDHRVIRRVGRLLLEGEQGLLGRDRLGAGRRRQQIVEAPRDRDDSRLQRSAAHAAVHRPELPRAADPVGLVSEDRAHDGGLVDVAERGQHGGRRAGHLGLLGVAEPRHDGRRVRPDGARQARTRRVEEQRGHRHAREDDDVVGDLPRHRDREDRGVYGSSRFVLVGVASRGDPEERRGLTARQVDEHLRDALHALRQAVLSALQLLEEAPHDHDRRRVHADDGLGLVEALDGRAALERRLADRAHADAGRGLLEALSATASVGLGERRDEREQVLRVHVARDRELGEAVLLEDLSELDGALVDLSIRLQQLAADEDRPEREEDGGVLIGALSVVVDDVRALLDLANDGLVVERVERRLLGQSEDRLHDRAGQIPRLDAPDVLADVLGDDVELCGGVHHPTTSPAGEIRRPSRPAIASAASSAASRSGWVFHQRRFEAWSTASSASRPWAC